MKAIVLGAGYATRLYPLTLELAKPKLERDVQCESIDGNVSLRLPAGYRGPIRLLSGTSEFDFGPNPLVAFLLDSDKRSARAFAGTPMSSEARVEAAKTNKWPPGVWGKTAKGKITFRIAGQK